MGYLANDHFDTNGNRHQLNIMDDILHFYFSIFLEMVKTTPNDKVPQYILYCMRRARLPLTTTSQQSNHHIDHLVKDL